MKKILVSLLVTIMLATLLQADTILTVEDTTPSSGTYTGAYWKLNDTGWTVTGDSLGSSALLQSVTWYKSLTSNAGTTGNLYLKIFTGDTGDSGDFVAISTNTVDVYNLGYGAAVTWNFNNIALDPSANYTYRMDIDNDQEMPGNVSGRFQIGDSVLEGETFVDSTGGKQQWGMDLNMQIQVIPEPVTTVLLGLGGSAFLVKRRKKCNFYNCRR